MNAHDQSALLPHHGGWQATRVNMRAHPWGSWSQLPGVVKVLFGYGKQNVYVHTCAHACMSARDHVLVRLQHATDRHLEVQAHYVTFTGACPFVPAPLLASGLPQPRFCCHRVRRHASAHRHSLPLNQAAANTCRRPAAANMRSSRCIPCGGGRDAARGVPRSLTSAPGGRLRPGRRRDSGRRAPTRPPRPPPTRRPRPPSQTRAW